MFNNNYLIKTYYFLVNARTLISDIDNTNIEKATFLCLSGSKYF